MISAESRPYIQASVPVLREHGLSISQRFYANLFTAHPELKNLFNMGNQANGAQQQSLAAAVFAYADHIDHPEALAPVLRRIAHKHVSIGLTADQYPIVGFHLLGAIKEVLGDAATPALIAAWAEAYSLLAQALISEEEQLMGREKERAGLHSMRISAVTEESAHVKSFCLVPIEGEAPPVFHPGQYITVAVNLAGGLRQLRQYSLSDAPGRPYLRISVKRELSHEQNPEGMVSNWLHEYAAPGTLLDVSFPFGDFTPVIDGSRPLVLLSAGVGITPMIAALNHAADIKPDCPMIFAHAARSEEHHAHREDIRRAQTRMTQLQTVMFYDAKEKGSPALIGPMQLAQLPLWDYQAADVYLCGPLPFILKTAVDFPPKPDKAKPDASLRRF